jgi:hypothetical protein
LRLTTDSVAHVFVEVVDEQGRLVKQADNEVRLMVRGARLLGMENGNIMDTSLNGQRNRGVRTHGGRLVAYIQPDQSAGRIVIQASSPFLQSQTIEIEQ